VQCLEYFIFVIEGAGKKPKSSVNDKVKNRRVHEVARYTKIHIKYNILISGKLRHPANFGPGSAVYSRFYSTVTTIWAGKPKNCVSISGNFPASVYSCPFSYNYSNI
jgi:hypothetical protein